MAIALLCFSIISLLLLPFASLSPIPIDGTSWNGYITKLLNLTVDPCDDFYQFACGNFDDIYTMSESRSKMSQFVVNDEIIVNKMLQLLNSKLEEMSDEQLAAGDAISKSLRYYKSCLQLESDRSNGISTMREMVTAMGNFWFSDEPMPNSFDLTQMIIAMSRFTPSNLFYWGVGHDYYNSSRYLLHVVQAGMIMGSGTTEFYVNRTLEDDPYLQALQTKLVEYGNIITGIDQDGSYEIITGHEGSGIESEEEEDELIIVSDRNVKKYVEEVIRLEQRFAEINEDIPNDQFSYVTLDWLDTEAPFVNWTLIFTTFFNDYDIDIASYENISITSEHWLVHIHAFVLKEMSTEQGRRALRNYLIFRAVDDYAPYFRAFQNACHEFKSVLKGFKKPKPLTEFCFMDTDVTIGFPLGTLYVKEHFSIENKHAVMNLTEHIVKAFRRRVEKADWLLNGTQESALRKIDSILYDVGFPDWILNNTYLDNRYENLTVTDDYSKNQFYAYNYSLTKELQVCLIDSQVVFFCQFLFRN